MLTRTFLISLRGSGKVGTGFLVDLEGRQYMVTAAHVVDGLVAPQELNIERNDKMEPAMATLVGKVAPPRADVAVLALDRLLIAPAPAPAVLVGGGVTVSENLYFLGFPLAMRTASKTLNGGYPIPLVKSGIVSGFIGDDTGTIGYYLDAMNNHGFSGGPVVTGGSPPKIVAIISGYLGAQLDALTDSGPSGIFVRENTGIVEAYNAEFALNIIKANPIGFVHPRP